MHVPASLLEESKDEKFNLSIEATGLNRSSDIQYASNQRLQRQLKAEERSINRLRVRSQSQGADK